MRISKLSLRVIDLSILAALGLMVFAAASAQAALPGETTAGKFSINGSAANLLATFTGSQEGAGTLLLVTGRNLEIRCTAADFKLEARLLAQQRA